MTVLNKNKLSLYIHWPYCESKCPYCDFNSHKIESVNEDDWIQAYTNQLYKMKDILYKYGVQYNKLSTIFFGGGTPSLMPLKVIENILCTADKIFKFEENIEITLEANPGSYEREKFEDIQKLGINRLSLGVQSLNNKNLSFLGRKHDYQDALIAVEMAMNTFSNVSTDLIYGLVGQTLKEWEKELSSFLKKFNLKHLSVYQLTIEEGTKFYTDFKKGLLKTINEDLSADFYNLTNDILNNYKYNRYEVSNHSKKKFESQHNLNYWNSENWIGIGPGAYSRLWSSNQKNKRFEIENYKSPKSWLSKNFDSSKFNQVKFIENHETNKDLLIMGLRLTKGIKINSLLDISIITNKKVLDLQNEKIININKGIIKVNKNHLIKLNSILKYLIS